MKYILFILGLFFFTASWAQLGSTTSYWKLDETSGALNDEISTNDGTGSTITYNVTGKINGAISLNGTSSYVSMPDAAALQMYTSDFTWWAWVYPTSFSTSWRGFIGGETGAFVFGTYGSSGTLGCAKNQIAGATSSGLNLTLNAWNFVSISFNSTLTTNNLTYRVNGSATTVTFNYDFDSGASSNLMGVIGSGVNYFPGYLDEIGYIKGVALSQSSIDSLYNGGTGITYPFEVGGGGTPSSGNIYVDPINGSDANSGHHPDTAISSLSALQTISTALEPGDTIFLSDTVHYGNLWLNNIDGDGSDDIVITTWNKYDHGVAKIKGMKQLSSWTSLGGNRWSKYDATLPTQELRNVHPENYHYYVMFLGGVWINGTHYKVGREPDTRDTYYNIETAYSTVPSTTGWYFVDNDNVTTNGTYNSAWAMIAEAKWEWGKFQISTQTGGTFNINSSSINAEERSYGFSNQTGSNKLKYLLVNDPDLCDNNGEWSYSASTQTITMYYNGALNSQTVYASNVDSVISLYDCDYITIKNIELWGGNLFQLHFINSDNVTVEDCNFQYSPYSAITARYSDNVIINNDTIYHAQNNGIRNFACTREVITNNYLYDVGTVPGNGGDTDGLHFVGIASHYGTTTDSVKIEYNVLDSIGGSGIFISSFSKTGPKNKVYRNLVMNHGNVINDMAGIYMYGDSTSQYKSIRGNVVYKAYPKASSTYDEMPQTYSIYLDENSGHWVVDSNYTYMSNAGFYQNPANRHNTFTNNTIFDASINDFLYDRHYGMRIRYTSYNTHVTKNNVVMNGDSAAAYVYEYPSSGGFIANFNYVDSNNYYNPFDNDQSHLIRRHTYPYAPNDFTTLSTWRTTTSNTWDMASTFNKNSFTKDSTTSYTYGKDIFYTPINWSSTSHYFDLGDCSFKKLDGTYVSDSIEISPYKSTVLFLRTGSLATTDEELFMGTPLAPGGALPTPTNSLLIRRRIIYIQL